MANADAQFAARDSKRPIEQLEIGDITPESMTRFLRFCAVTTHIG